MSRGLGSLQQRLLANLQSRELETASARKLLVAILDEDCGRDSAAAFARVRSPDRSVRRALRLMERRGLVAEVGRFAKFRRKSLVVYATAKGAAEWAEMIEMSQVYFARRDAALAALEAVAPAKLQVEQPRPPSAGQSGPIR